MVRFENVSKVDIFSKVVSHDIFLNLCRKLKVRYIHVSMAMDPNFLTDLLFDCYVSICID